MTAEPIPLRIRTADDDARLADDRRAVLRELVDRALGPHAHKTSISVDEYAKDVAHCGRQAAYSAVERGQIPSFKVAGRIRVPIPAIAAQLMGVDVTKDGP